MKPTWDDLIARNRETAAKFIYGTVHSAGNVGNGWVTREVWVGPEGLCRVVDGDTVLMVGGHGWCYQRTELGMERKPGKSTFVLPRSDKDIEIFTMHLDWPAPAPPPEAAIPLEGSYGVARISVTSDFGTAVPDTYRPTGAVQAATVRGREGWTVPCGWSPWSGTPDSVIPVALTFDAATGVVIARNAGKQCNVVEVSDLVVTDTADPAIFTYTDAFIDHAAAQDIRANESRLEESFRELGGRGNTIDRYLTNTTVSLVVRTDFSRDDIWQQVLQCGVVASDDNLFEPFDLFDMSLVPIDNPAYTGWGPTEVLAAIASDPSWVFLVDSVTVEHPDRPLLLIDTGDDEPPENPDHPDESEYPGRGTQLRVALAEVSGVEMGMKELGISPGEYLERADSDGIYRG